MNRQQQREYVSKCVKGGVAPNPLPVPTFDWSLAQTILKGRAGDVTPTKQALQLLADRPLFGEVLVAFYDLNVQGFSCVWSARGELLISAANKEYHE